MIKIFIGFVLGVVAATIGFTGFIKLMNEPEVAQAAKIADQNVASAQKLLKENSK